MRVDALSCPDVSNIIANELGSHPGGAVGLTRQLAIVTLALCGSAISLSCEPAAGQFRVAFIWEVPPIVPVFVWARVEERESPAAVGTTLASVGPERVAPGDGSLALELGGVPYGADRYVVVEVREAANAALRVLYYGISEPFTLRPGDRGPITAPVLLRIPESAEHPGEVRLLFDGAPRTRVPPADLTRATVETRSARAVAVVLANDPSFSANLTTVRFDEADRVACVPEPDASDPDLTWDVCRLDGWDLTAGAIPEGEANVYARFVDVYGYESPVARASAIVDASGPEVLAASLSPDVAGLSRTVSLQLNLTEALGAGPEAAILRVEPSGEGAPAFTGPVAVGASSAYVWTATIDGRGPAGAYTFAVRLADDFGNTAAEQALHDAAGAPLVLRIDAEPPALAADVPVVYSRSVFGRGEDGGPTDPLSFFFALEDANPPALPADGCDGCPQVLVEGRAVGVLARHAALDRADAGRLGFRYTLDVDPRDWGDIERDVRVAVRWADRAGNESEIDLPGPLRFDFVRPTATSCALTPDVAGAGATLRYSLSAREPLSTAPALVATGVPGLFADPAAVSGSGLVYTWSQPADELPDGSFSVQARLVDVAGNETPDACPAVGEVDTSAPDVSAAAITTDPVVRDAAGAIVRAVGPGDTLEVRYRIREARGLAAGTPLVTLQAAPPVPLPEVARTEVEGETVEFVHRLVMTPADLPAGAEGSWPVRAVVRDAAGNETALDGLLDGVLVRVDFTPPAAECQLVPDPAEGPYAIDQPVRLQVSPLEVPEPGAAPVVVEAFDPPRAAPFFTYEPTSTYRLTGLVAAGDGEPTFEVGVRLRDLVGNETPPGETACTAGLLGGALDGDAPDVAGVTLELFEGDLPPELPVALRAGRTVRAGVTVQGVGPEDIPVVELGRGRMTSTGAPTRAGEHAWTWAFDRTLEGTEGEGAALLAVSGTDAAGNPYRHTQVFAETALDFTDPEAECFLNLPQAAAGDVVRLSVTFSEPIAAAEPALVSDLPLELREAPEPGVRGPQRFVYAYEVPAEHPPFDWTYTLSATDRAGNPVAAADRCAGGGLVDGAPIVVSAASVSASYEDPDHPGTRVPSGLFVKAGGQVEVRFTLDEPPADGTLRVRAGETEVSSFVRSGLTYTFTHAVAADGAEGPAPVTVEAADPVGNRTIVAAGTVTRDFHLPALSGVPYFERDDGYPRARVAANDVWAKAGTRVTASFAVDEPTSLAPVVTVAGVDFAPASWVYADTFVVADVDGPDADQVAVVTARVTDRAGNRADLDLGRIRYDYAAPGGATAERQAATRFFRAPWGAEETGGAALAELRACPPSADPGSPWEWCPAGAAPFEAGALVTARAASLETGRPECLPKVLAEGGEEADRSVRLVVTGDHPAVCVSETDPAGNESPATLVERVEWVATMGFKVAGSVWENPHRFESRGRFAPYLLQEKEGDVEEGGRAGISRVDGVTRTASGGGAWLRRRGPPVAPTARCDLGLAYDSARGKLVLFGGMASSDCGEDTGWICGATWEAAGSDWVRVADGGPAARYGHSMVYDSRRGRTVLFGGMQPEGGCGEGDDGACGYTWEWDGNTWRVAATAGPARGFGWRWDAATYDAGRGRVVAFRRGETWEWDGAAWEQVATTGPSTGGGMAYDAGRGRVTLFGDGSGPEGFGDTWEWDGDSWTKVATTGPKARAGFAMAYDAARGRVVLDGGHLEPGDCGEGSGRHCPYTWEWDGHAWTAAATAGINIACGAMAYDAVRGRVVRFGGFGVSAIADTWEWEGDGWLRVAVTGPSPRTQPALVYDAGRGRTLLVGGSAPAGAADAGHTWAWDGSGWSDLGPGGPSAACVAAQDMARDTTVALAGADTWESDGTAWLKLSNTAPEAGWEYAGAYHAGRGEFVVLGGDRWSHGTGDLWGWNGASWTPIASGPEAGGHAVAYDSARDRLVAFGSEGWSCWPRPCRGQTWEWDGGEWSEGPDTAPTGRLRAAMAYDADRGKIVLFGGGGEEDVSCYEGSNWCCGYTWEWDGTTWARVASSGPTARADHALAYDAGRGRVLLFGGRTEDDFGGCREPGGSASPKACSYTWEWDGGARARPAQVMAAAFEAAGTGGREVVDSVSVTWLAGGVGFPQEGEDNCGVDTETGIVTCGVDLLVWDEGTWKRVASNGAPPATPAPVRWTTSDPRVSSRIFFGDSRTLAFAVVPAAPNGEGSPEGDDPACAADGVCETGCVIDADCRYARVSSDYVEVRVVYGWPPAE